MKTVNFGTRIRESLLSNRSQTSINALPAKVAFTTPQSSSRQFHSDKPSQKKVSSVVGRFPFDTYIDAKGFHINPTKKEDRSANVGLVKSPQGYQEFKEESDRWGFHNLYKSGDSYFSISFSDDFSSTLSIDQIAHQKNQIFFDKYPEGQVYPLSLHKDVTDHLKHVEFRSFVMEAGTKGLYEDSYGKMNLFVKTPGGVWDLGWHSARKNLHDSSHQLGFVNAIKNFRVILKEAENTESTEEKNEVLLTKTVVPESKINKEK